MVEFQVCSCLQMGLCLCKLAQGTPSCKAFPAITVAAHEHKPKPYLPCGSQLHSPSSTCSQCNNLVAFSVALREGEWETSQGFLEEGLWQTLRSSIKTENCTGFTATDKGWRKKCTTLVLSLGIAQSFLNLEVTMNCQLWLSYLTFVAHFYHGPMQKTMLEADINSCPCFRTWTL